MNETKNQCTRLYECYELMSKHVSYAQAGFDFCNINQSFGKDTQERLSSYPHIVWIPTGDSYGFPKISNQPAIVSGRRVIIDGIRTRNAGCDLYLYHQDYHEMEGLINDLHLALYDCFVAAGETGDAGNFMIGNGRWDVNESVIANNTVCYVQSVVFQFPVYRLLPAEILQTATINFNV